MGIVLIFIINDLLTKKVFLDVVVLKVIID